MLEVQSREEEIINQELKNKKLELIEGLWQWQSKTGVHQEGSLAIYKKENTYIILSPGFEKEGRVSQITKFSENKFIGKCSMIIPIAEQVSGDLEIFSIDDNKLSWKCFRLNYISKLDKLAADLKSTCLYCKPEKAKAEDYIDNWILVRVWPEDIKVHNKKF